MANPFSASAFQGSQGRGNISIGGPGRASSFGFSGINGTASSSPPAQDTNNRGGVAQNEEVTSPSKLADSLPTGKAVASGKHYLRTLLASSMFKQAQDPFNKRNTNRGMKQWLLFNICYVFIVKAGRAELETVYNGKQDGAIINELYKPKDSEMDSGVRGANGAVLTPAQLHAIGNSRANRGAVQAPAVTAHSDSSARKDGRYTYKDGDKGDIGICRKFIVLNDELVINGVFSFSNKWATVYDRNIDPKTRALFDLFGTKNPSEFDFSTEGMLHGKYGVAPWSVKTLPSEPIPVTPSSGAVPERTVVLQLPMCIFDNPSDYEVRLFRPFFPFTSKKDITTREINDIEGEPLCFVLTLAGDMPEHMETANPLESSTGDFRKRKFAEISSANFPISKWRNEIELPLSVNRDEYKFILHEGSFITRFTKRADLEKKKLVMVDSDDE